MLTPAEIQYLRNWQFSIVNFIRDRDLDLIRCLRMISTRMLPGMGPPFNLEEHRKQTDFSEADERMSSGWTGAIEGMIRRGDNELAHLFRTVSDEVMNILGLPNILQERPWVHPHKILGGMCRHLASLRRGRGVLNRCLYRNKFKPRTHTGASSRATTWEADIADSIASMAESSEGRKHLDDCILNDFSRFFDWEKTTSADDDTDDEDCPPLEDVGANGKKSVEKMYHAGLLHLTKEDVRGRTIREVITEALASGRRARNSATSDATGLPSAGQAPPPGRSETTPGTDTRPTRDDHPEEAMSISRKTSLVCMRRVMRVTTPDRELESTPSTSTQDASTSTSPPKTSGSTARRKFIFDKGRRILARAIATLGMEGLPSNESDDFMMGSESTAWFLEFIDTLSDYEYNALEVYHLKGDARRLEVEKAAALEAAAQRAKSAKRSKKSKKKSK
jgi:hypothetical protein